MAITCLINNSRVQFLGINFFFFVSKLGGFFQGCRIGTVKAFNFGPHGNCGLLFSKGLIAIIIAIMRQI